MVAEKVPSKQAHIQLPWVHTAIGNAKKVLQGIHQHVKPEYLQNYLDEKDTGRSMISEVPDFCTLYISLIPIPIGECKLLGRPVVPSAGSAAQL